jgi:tetratricopeptide (TPR) repeat protein
MSSKLTASLRAAPATIPALAAVALLIAWATDQAGYPVTHWGPGGLIVLALLGVALGTVGLRWAEVSLPVRIALLCLAAYTALSFLSILWAAVPGDAWEGANRTLLYLFVFALFACWRQRGVSAALLLVVWTLAMIGLAAFVALHLSSLTSGTLQSLLPGGRLIYPSGYANANAALWLMAFWPALLLARSARLPWGLRGALAGGAVLLAEVALLSQSRGSLYATPVMLGLVFLFLPERTRTFAMFVPVAAGIGAAAPSVLHVGNRLHNGSVSATTLHSATTAMFAAALIVGMLTAAGAAAESRLAIGSDSAGRIRRVTGAVAIAALVALAAGGWVAVGDPIARVHHAWETFKSGSGYAANGKGSRLTSGLGSNRYDFYRVSLDEFLAHPVVGIGADNFQQQYLAHGRSHETPRYPHSIELRTLVQTGLVGALLALLGLGGALLASARAIRPSRARGAGPPQGADPLAAAVAAAALSGFAYWGVHGSFDWFWEFAGLGAPAFALLGLACALAPSGRATTKSAASPAGAANPAGGANRADVANAARTPSARLQAIAARRSARRLAAVAGVLVTIAAVVSLAAPWLSQLQVESAVRVWTYAPLSAYARLNDAAGLNPLSDEPYLVAGSIALRFGDLARAEHEFTLALSRSPNDAYATLELGAIASTRGDRRQALSLLERAERLNPRDGLTREAVTLAREGRRVNVQELNRSILVEGQQFA